VGVFWIVVAFAAFGWHRLVTRLLALPGPSRRLARLSERGHLGLTVALLGLELLLLTSPWGVRPQSRRAGWWFVLLLAVLPALWVDGTRRWKALRKSGDAPGARPLP
jgi:hypothetical protein